MNDDDDEWLLSDQLTNDYDGYYHYYHYFWVIATKDDVVD